MADLSLLNHARLEDGRLDHARRELRPVHRTPEPDVLRPLLARAASSAETREAIERRASGLLAELRAGQSHGWVNQFLQEYRLNSSEGVALLSLAEAFLRVPDADTAERLIADKIGNADWRAHSGKSTSAIVNSATWGLVFGRALMRDDSGASALRRLLNRTGEPFVRQAVGAAMRMMGELFVMGRTIDEALTRMKNRDNRGFTASFDMLGEAARTQEDAERFFKAYEKAIAAVGKNAKAGHSISVKLSALHPRYEVPQRARCVDALVEQVGTLARQAADAGIPMTIDAEESERLEMSLDIIEAVARMPELRGWNGLGMAVQAYSKRARGVIQWADALGAETGRSMAVRLVKGAYWDSEIKKTQEQGLEGYPLFTRKAATDVSYLACARDMLAAEHIFPAFASHNALTVGTILEWAEQASVAKDEFEFQRLHGMGEGLYERLVREEGYQCRIYAPVGGHRDLLAYLVRRLLENGANSSFVHQLSEQGITDEELLSDPVAKIAAVGGAAHPMIPLPDDIFGEGRRNSEGIDLQDEVELARVTNAIAAHYDSQGQDPIAPFDKETRLRTGQLVDYAAAAYPAWNARPVEERAQCLERLADLLEEDRDALMAIAVHEAKKTIDDALAEVREAVDFCRYYAQQARIGLQPQELPGPTGERNVLRMGGRGVFACISPWNFPLAIFTGEVVAALVTGNTVVAKPAPQTPRIAARAVALAYEAGIPKDVLLLAHASPEAGQALVENPKVSGVVFTGSTRTAKGIARALVANDERPIVPLIAETGGLNAMIVDSTALHEQAVADIVKSAFKSAGQRCSALRLLLVQEDIAEPLLKMLYGAMDTLILGDPADPMTDIGPVIDQPAYDRLMGYRHKMKARIGKTVEAPVGGLFVPPTVIRLDKIEDLHEEWFGPILHVATLKRGKIADTINRVNALGYGLTMGVHSRIALVAAEIEARAKVGNLYVNRNMTGAIVGSQPFGGEGLSGTGPKAGGPHYLPRFCVERVTSTDTTSSGGNATLLNLEEGF